MAADQLALDPGKTRLLVIDVQNDFCHAEGAFGRMGIPMEPIQAMVPRLETFIEDLRRAGVPIIFVRTEHSDWTNSAAWLTRRISASGKTVLPCLEGSWGAEFYHVKPTPADRVVTKHRYSAFLGTDLDLLLRSHAVTHLLFTGVATNVCVESAARDAFGRDYHVILVEDGCAAATAEEHQGALVNVTKYFGTVLRATDVLAALNR